MRVNSKYRIGIDLGGTKIEGVILDAHLNEVFRTRIPTEQEKGYGELLLTLKNLYTLLCDKIHHHPHTLGIGTPGSISKQTGLIKNCNIVCMNGKMFKEDLERLIARKFVRQNDSNCFAIAEALMGAGKEKKSVFGIILGTGVGGGYVYQGKLISGLQSLMGEWGHTIINSTGEKCYCGKIGCIETYISGKGVENKYYLASNEKLPMEDIVKRYRLGETTAQLIMSDFFSYFGKACSNLIGIMDPDIIVVGGGLSNIDELYVLGINKVKDYIFNDTLITPIVKNKLGDSAGVIGAALLGK